MKIPSATTAAIITLAAIAVAAVTTSIAGPTAPAAGPQPTQDGSVAHGRYLVSIAGCHDCHTPGYAQTGGHAPPANWLTGSPVGFQGPWGVSYPANLRLTVRSMTEAAVAGVCPGRAASAHAVVQPARHERSGPDRYLPVHPFPRSGGHRGPGPRGSGRQSQHAVH